MLTDEEIWYARELVEDGKTLQQIQHLFPCSISTIQRLLQDRFGMGTHEMRTGVKRKVREDWRKAEEDWITFTPTVKNPQNYSNNHFNARQIIAEKMGRLIRR